MWKSEEIYLYYYLGYTGVSSVYKFYFLFLARSLGKILLEGNV